MREKEWQDKEIEKKEKKKNCKHLLKRDSDLLRKAWRSHWKILNAQEELTETIVSVCEYRPTESGISPKQLWATFNKTSIQKQIFERISLQNMKYMVFFVPQSLRVLFIKKKKNIPPIPEYWSYNKNKKNHRKTHFKYHSPISYILFIFK